MGIRDLWKQIEPLKRLVSLLELSVQEGFLRNSHKTRTLVVGIDASVWIVECQAVFYVRGLHTQAGKNPELRTLFFRLAHLLCYPITVIFVFDGPERPGYKRGTQVKKKAHWAMKDLSELIKGFRYKFHNAPGEAEAELAELEKHGIIDFAVTSDCDYFLFGGTRLIRRLHMKKDGDDDAEIYTTKDAAMLREMGFATRAGFLLIAVLHGADYDTAGLPGCGIVTATRLASTNLATDLLAAAEVMTEAELKVYLKTWRSQLRNTLANDPSGNLPNHCATLATKVPNDFPNAHIVHLYAHPITSWSNGGGGPDLGDLSPQFPDTEQLAFQCERLFGWGTTIVEQFERHIWRGYCFRALSQLNNFSGQASLLSPSSIRHIHAQDTRFKSDSAFECYCVEMWLRPLPVTALYGARRALEDENAIVKGGATCTSISVWVPGPILRTAAPAVIKDFLSEAPSRKKKAAAPTTVYVPILPAMSDVTTLAGTPSTSGHIPGTTSSRKLRVLDDDSDHEHHPPYKQRKLSMSRTAGTSKLNGTLSDEFSDTSVELDDTDCGTHSERNTIEVISTSKGCGTTPEPINVTEAAISDCDEVEIVSASNLQYTMASEPIEVSDSDEAVHSECDEVEIVSASNLQCTTASEPIEISDSEDELVLPPGVSGTWVDLTQSASSEEEIF